MSLSLLIASVISHPWTYIQESVSLKVMLLFEWFPKFAMINTICKLAYSSSWCSKMKIKFKHILDGQQ